MSRLKPIIIMTALAALCVPGIVVAQDDTAQRDLLIRQHCQQLHGIIDQLQRRDLVSRTNLGREYENTAHQLDAFNQRIHNNNLNSQRFEDLYSQFNDATGQFRDAYVHYDDSLNALQQINCQTDPAGFDAKLGQARGLRDATAGAVLRAAALLQQYRAAAIDQQAALPAANGGKP